MSDQLVYHGALSAKVLADRNLRFEVLQILLALAATAAGDYASCGESPGEILVTDGTDEEIVGCLFRWDVWKSKVEPSVTGGSSTPSLRLIQGGASSPGDGDDA